MSYTREETLEIVKTIFQQLRATTPINILMSWQLSKKMAMTFDNMPTLALRVSGLLHKGWVYVSYDGGRDLYNLYFVSVRGVIKKRIEGVYCDEFGSIIDETIERGTMSDDEYKKRAMADSARKLSR